MSITPSLSSVIAEMDSPRGRWVGSGRYVERGEGDGVVRYFASGPDGQWWSHDRDDGLIVHDRGRFWEAQDPFHWTETIVEGGQGVHHDGMLKYLLEPSADPICAPGPEDYLRTRGRRRNPTPTELLEVNDALAEIRYTQPPGSTKPNFTVTYDRSQGIIVRLASEQIGVEYALEELASGPPPDWLFLEPLHEPSGSAD